MRSKFLFPILLLISIVISGENLLEEDYLSLFYPKSQIVSGVSKFEEDVKKAPALVRVFTKEEIKDLGVETLRDLLELLPSAVLTPQTNSRTSLWFRGIRNRYNDKILILFDSIPISDPIYSHSPVDEYLPIENIERIEVILGPSSAIYGSNAFSGVINIITKRFNNENELFNITLKSGNYDTKGAFIECYLNKKAYKIYTSFSYFETDGDGLDRQRHFLPQTLKWNPKERYSFQFSLDYKGFIISSYFFHYYHTFYTDWDVPHWRWKDEGYFYNDSMTSIKKEYSLNKRLSLKFVGYYCDYDLYNFWREFDYTKQNINSTYDDVLYDIDAYKNGIKIGTDLQFEYSTKETSKTTFGLNILKTKSGRVEDIWLDVHSGKKDRPFFMPIKSLTDYSLYFQQYNDWKKVIFLGGFRLDHLSLYGYKLTPRMNFVFLPKENLIFKVLYGEAFRQPSFREYFTVDLTHSFPSGNEDLKPEKLKNIELSLNYYTKKAGNYTLSIFSEWTYDEIFSEKNGPYSNHKGHKIQGFEFYYNLMKKNMFDFKIGYSRIWASLYNVPPYALKFEGIFYLLDKIHLSLFGGYVSKRPRDSQDLFYYDPTRPPYKRDNVGGYFQINSSITIFPIFKNFELSLTVLNLLDRNYYHPTFEPTKYYDLKAPNRTFLLRIGKRF